MVTPQAVQPRRRGLPRVSGGEPWPPLRAGGDPVAAPTAVAAAPHPPAPVAAASTPSPRDAATTGAPPATVSAPRPRIAEPVAGAVLQRRGLPRVAGGEPWPPARAVPATATVIAPAPDEPADTDTMPEPADTDTMPEPGAEPATAETTTERAAARRRYRGRTVPHWAGIGVLAAGALLLLGALAVLVVRWMLGTEPLQNFLTDYPGEYHLPEEAPVGIPWWLSWAHFFNVFLMVLIIRSGFQIRTEKRPTAFWTPNWNPKRKISLTIWFHQSLDLLWLLNGAIFLVLLFATGHWVKIVPTSWEVFPNALSAGLQYASLNWPTENGWVNYNSLQQLAYFATVFLAAPLAVASGIRMSGLWPKNAPRLNKIYPIELARAIHFPVMLYFVVFIIFHVTLVLATGALRNLNHMYAGQDVVNWTGFWIFAASLLVIAGGIVAARPLIIAPIAALFGRVGR